MTIGKLLNVNNYIVRYTYLCNYEVMYALIVKYRIVKINEHVENKTLRAQMIPQSTKTFKSSNNQIFLNNLCITRYSIPSKVNKIIKSEYIFIPFYFLLIITTNCNYYS